MLVLTARFPAARGTTVDAGRCSRIYDKQTTRVVKAVMALGIVRRLVRLDVRRAELLFVVNSPKLTALATGRRAPLVNQLLRRS